MFPRPMPRSEPSFHGRGPQLLPDLGAVLEQHIASGLPPDLALDLVLNEVVVRAAEATAATAAALALLRGTEMICRAATGLHAPDLGIPLDTHGGLSGACVRTHEPQLSDDAESDPRIDPAVARRLGIRSILIVPVFEGGPGAARQIMGVLEVFSPRPQAFSRHSQTMLEYCANKCIAICRLAERSQKKSSSLTLVRSQAERLDRPQVSGDDSVNVSAAVPPADPPPYEAWSLLLGGMAIAAVIGVSFLVGSRIGWMRSSPAESETARVQSSSQSSKSLTSRNDSATSGKAQGSSAKTAAKHTKPDVPEEKTVAPSSDELVVYERGKVVFRMKPAPDEATAGRDAAGRSAQRADSTRSHLRSAVVPAVTNDNIAAEQAVWLAPAEAEGRLLSRVEPEYPADALAAHRSGNVVLEVHVAADGSVSSVRTLSGDPILAEAASDAVKNWRYQPFRPHQQTVPFQTDVTLTFSLPN